MLAKIASIVLISTMRPDGVCSQNFFLLVDTLSSDYRKFDDDPTTLSFQIVLFI